MLRQEVLRVQKYSVSREVILKNEKKKQKTQQLQTAANELSLEVLKK